MTHPRAVSPKPAGRTRRNTSSAFQRMFSRASKGPIDWKLWKLAGYPVDSGRLATTPCAGIAPVGPLTTYRGHLSQRDRQFTLSSWALWCGRRDLNPHGLAACGFSYHLGFRRPARGGFVVWTIPSPFLPGGLGAARLVSTPSRSCIRAWLGIAIAGFPDFEQFYATGFPMGTQALKSAASAISPRPQEIAASSS